MRVLALDTTTRAGSVALVEDDRIIAEHAGDPMLSHAERLPGDIVELLNTAAVSFAAIDLYAVAAGPGSFTGLRIGIATIQGLAFVNRRRIASVSALEALAQAASSDLAPGTIVAVWMDAYRRDVFSALYRVGEAPTFDPGRLTEIDAPVVEDPISILSRWSESGGAPSLFIGDGAVEYAHLIAAEAQVIEPPMLAGPIGRMAVARARRGQTIDPSAVQPLYIRRPDAEVARDALHNKA